MGDIIWLYKGKPIRNLDCYFLEDGACIEEFDTDDGHFVLGADIEDYPPDVRELAVKNGIIDEQGRLLPGEPREMKYI